MLFLTKIFIHLILFGPLVWLYYRAITDTIGADPVEQVIHFTGIGALNLILITLCISPIAKRFKKPLIIKYRRVLGLWAFTYACMHLLNFIFFELQFNWSLFFSEIIKRPYIFVGMFAFIILSLLAVTSHHAIKRSMGAKWQQLHYWVYFAAVLAVIHFLWSMKSDIYEPLMYAVALSWLLYLRRFRIRSWLCKIAKSR